MCDHGASSFLSLDLWLLLMKFSFFLSYFKDLQNNLVCMFHGFSISSSVMSLGYLLMFNIGVHRSAKSRNFTFLYDELSVPVRTLCSNLTKNYWKIFIFKFLLYFMGYRYLVHILCICALHVCLVPTQALDLWDWIYSQLWAALRCWR